MSKISKSFDGRTIRDEILEEVKAKIKSMPKPPSLTVVSVGSDPVCEKYVGFKEKAARELGIPFHSVCLPEDVNQESLIKKIQELNQDKEIQGIMIQIPLPSHLDKFEVVNAIAKEKDLDGLRFCGGFSACFKPPVVLAIFRAIAEAIASERNKKQVTSNKKIPIEIDKLQNLIADKEVVIVGRGFLVGWPLYQCLEEAVPGLVVADRQTKNLIEITKNADILISATGQESLIKPEMIKEGVVLIDAGTTEIGGQLKGDIDPACYEKASYYTPVPGGIGPVTVAMLFKNLVSRNG